LRTVKDRLEGSTGVYYINAEDVDTEKENIHKKHHQHDDDDDSINTNHTYHYQMVKKVKGKPIPLTGRAGP
jgi:hypothetical protein